MKTQNKLIKFLLGQSGIIYRNSSRNTGSAYFDIVDSRYSIRLSDHIGHFDDRIISIIKTNNNDGYIVVDCNFKMMYVKTYEEIKHFLKSYIFIVKESRFKSEDTDTTNTETDPNIVTMDLTKLNQSCRNRIKAIYNLYKNEKDKRI